MLVNWYASIGQGQGYSGASENIILALKKLGVDVRLLSPRKIIKQNLRLETLALLAKPFQLGKIGINFGFPAGFNSVLNEIKIGSTMFETSKLPNGIGFKGEGNDWAGITGNAMDMINGMTELWVPCKHNVDLFRKEGTTIPIKKILCGIDPEMYQNMTEQRAATRKDRPFTFLMTGTLTSRKNPAYVITAFMNLFTGNKNVKLILKTQSGTLGHLFKFPDSVNIEIIDRLATVAEMQKLYEQADAFVFPSRGEGFGLPPVEAMATGLPTIFADNTGMSEFANPEYNYPISCPAMTQVSRYPKNWGNVGEWYEPSFTELKEKMKYVVEHEAEAKEKGLKASKWVLENFTYHNTALAINKRLKELAGE
jgi:glycosyltransferase involved in cell wall biosynthesis